VNFSWFLGAIHERWLLLLPGKLGDDAAKLQDTRHYGLWEPIIWLAREAQLTPSGHDGALHAKSRSRGVDAVRART